MNFSNQDRIFWYNNFNFLYCIRSLFCLILYYISLFQLIIFHKCIYKISYTIIYRRITFLRILDIQYGIGH